MPHRRQLLDLLSEYLGAHPDESETTRRLTSFVERQPLCFERSLAEGHITGSAWLTSPDGRDVLLTHHRKLGAWFQLGGHADGESDVLAVALQEAREESGIEDIEAIDAAIFDLDIHEIPARRTAPGESEPAHLHYDVRFCFEAKPGHGAAIASPESHAVRWIAVEELADWNVDDSVKRMARKWQSRRQRGRSQ